MAEQATYVGIESRSINNSTTALAAFVRVIKGSDGLCTVADATVRGDFTTLAAIPASTAGLTPVAGPSASMSGGGKVPMVASEAVAVGDLAYAAAAGKASKTSTNAALLGKWALAASADGVVGEVELFSVA